MSAAFASSSVARASTSAPAPAASPSSSPAPANSPAEQAAGLRALGAAAERVASDLAAMLARGDVEGLPAGLFARLVRTARVTRASAGGDAALLRDTLAAEYPADRLGEHVATVHRLASDLRATAESLAREVARGRRARLGLMTLRLRLLGLGADVEGLRLVGEGALSRLALRSLTTLASAIQSTLYGIGAAAQAVAPVGPELPPRGGRPGRYSPGPGATGAPWGRPRRPARGCRRAAAHTVG